MSALPPEADISRVRRDVRFVPEADVGSAYSITSSARPSRRLLFIVHCRVFLFFDESGIAVRNF
jgi:hypothetical protein